jgi:uncharacterized protein YoxC
LDDVSVEGAGESIQSKVAAIINDTEGILDRFQGRLTIDVYTNADDFNTVRTEVLDLKNGIQEQIDAIGNSNIPDNLKSKYTEQLQVMLNVTTRY